MFDFQKSRTPKDFMHIVKEDETYSLEHATDLRLHTFEMRPEFHVSFVTKITDPAQLATFVAGIPNSDKMRKIIISWYQLIN